MAVTYCLYYMELTTVQNRDYQMAFGCRRDGIGAPWGSGYVIRLDGRTPLVSDVGYEYEEVRSLDQRRSWWVCSTLAAPAPAAAMPTLSVQPACLLLLTCRAFSYRLAKDEPAGSEELFSIGELVERRDTAFNLPGSEEPWGCGYVTSLQPLQVTEDGVEWAEVRKLASDWVWTAAAQAGATVEDPQNSIPNSHQRFAGCG